MSIAEIARVPCSVETRDRLRAAKRGGDRYDDLFRKMLEQYDPETTRQEA